MDGVGRPATGGVRDEVQVGGKWFGRREALVVDDDGGMWFGALRSELQATRELRVAA